MAIRDQRRANVSKQTALLAGNRLCGHGLKSIRSRSYEGYRKYKSLIDRIKDGFLIILASTTNV